MKQSLPIIALLGLFAASAVAAQEESTERWYQVEMILFLNQTSGVTTREQWPLDPGVPATEGAAILEQVPEAAAGLIPFQALTTEELELKGAYAKLERSPHYHPLLHVGWRQPFSEGQEEFTPVLIRAPLEPEARLLGNAANTAPGREEKPSEAPPVWSVDQLAGPKPMEGIEGTVRLRVARYLHLDVDLLYRKERPLLPEVATQLQLEGSAVTETTESTLAAPAPVAPTLPFFGGLMADFSGLPATYMQGYRMTEQRRLRREELHYFDHPMFGLLVKVTAYEPPPPETVEVPVTPNQPPATGPALPVPVSPTGKATPQPLR
ncbi:MAG: hypothetical protein Kow006_09140 [Gammaproteobacteria bacterium]